MYEDGEWAHIRHCRTIWEIVSFRPTRRDKSYGVDLVRRLCLSITPAKFVVTSCYVQK